MKIFGWMQRRLHQNVVKDALSKNVTKDNNTKDLIEEVALIDVLEGWSDGVLTIGTFGFDPLKPFLDEQNHYFISESEEDNDYEDDIFSDNIESDNDEEKEVNPLMFTTFEDNFDYISKENKKNIINDDDIKSSTMLVVQYGPNFEMIEIDQGLKARTTLEELFMADSSYVIVKKKDIKSKFIKFEHDPRKKSSLTQTKSNHLSFAKKLVPRVGKNLHPVKKLNKMMKKMLKRKIHPYIETHADNSKSDIVEVVEGSISLL